MAKKVIVAMSGGVDSSLTAALLQESGYEIIGVHMRLHAMHADAPAPTTRGRLNHGCCNVEDVDDARMVAYELGIPFYVLNFEPEFQQHIIGNFVQEYSRGRTPYPCLNCNRYVKFDALMERAVTLGADYMATGHYARIVQDAAGRFHLHRAADRGKDQAYVLYHLSQAALGRLLLPLGEYDKPTVRRLAAERNLIVADKPDSQEICFIPDNNYRNFLEQMQPGMAQPGLMVNTRGEVVGQHTGLPHYTVGQRKGLGALGAEPHFVLRLDPATNTLLVGTVKELAAYSLTADDVHFVDGTPREAPFAATAKIRYRAPEAPALVTPLVGGRVRVDFTDPQRAITPGQAVVFYDGDEVLGGGTIENPAHAAPGIPAATVAA
ncbi:MAG TPA: tRNA 2-thiouridine(34) synthase MnmA [Chloroflexia bacterium]|nr:tRNA 2-thiouridine(34) synthase MnmA [Chloroflexia bacterium]